MSKAIGAWVALLVMLAGPADADSIQIAAHAIPLFDSRPDEHHTGRLIYRGGLELSSSDSRFGGLSDLIVSSDGTRILAISDMAYWLKARLTYDTQGNLAGMTDAEMASMLNEAGAPMVEKEGDAEGLTAVTPREPWGTVLVSFERNVRVWRYDLSHGLNAKPANMPIGPWVAPLDNNKQLEAITLFHPDTLLAFAEEAPDGGDIPAAFEAYPGDPAHMNTRLMTVAVHKPFAITSAATAPDGSVFMLERRFSLLGGLGMEIRHIPPDDFHPGARIEGTVLATLGSEANIDNMEGIAVRKGPRGETLLYVISDDNYNALERTVLMMFEVQ